MAAHMMTAMVTRKTFLCCLKHEMSRNSVAHTVISPGYWAGEVGAVEEVGEGAEEELEEPEFAF